MREQILTELKLIETTEQCRVLYACESGSRAWGFASPDSDFDLRFIYVQSLEWHLRLDPVRDTLDRMAENDLDLSGWELGKMLRLFAGCNLALNEWFDSPEIYFENPDFAAEIRTLIPQYFNPIKAVHHYRSIAANMLEQELHGSEIKIKKAFYVLRPLLACLWVFHRRSMPPTQFEDLIGSVELPVDVLRDIRELQERKKLAAEGEIITLRLSIVAWVDAVMKRIQENAGQLPSADRPDWEPLNRLFFRWVAGDIVANR